MKVLVLLRSVRAEVLVGVSPTPLIHHRVQLLTKMSTTRQLKAPYGVRSPVVHIQVSVQGFTKSYAYVNHITMYAPFVHHFQQ